MGPVIAFFFVLATYPVWIIALLMTFLIVSMLTHVPRIYALYGSHTRLWAVLVIAVIGVGAGTYLVFQAPFVGFPATAPKPETTFGLLLSAWSLFAWVVASELNARIGRQEREDNLDTYLGDFSSAPPNGKVMAGAR